MQCDQDSERTSDVKWKKWVRNEIFVSRFWLLRTVVSVHWKFLIKHRRYRASIISPSIQKKSDFNKRRAQEIKKNVSNLSNCLIFHARQLSQMSGV